MKALAAEREAENAKRLNFILIYFKQLLGSLLLDRGFVMLFARGVQDLRAPETLA